MRVALPHVLASICEENFADWYGRDIFADTFTEDIELLKDPMFLGRIVPEEFKATLHLADRHDLHVREVNKVVSYGGFTDVHAIDVFLELPSKFESIEDFLPTLAEHPSAWEPLEAVIFGMPAEDLRVEDYPQNIVPDFDYRYLGEMPEGLEDYVVYYDGTIFAYKRDQCESTFVFVKIN